MTQLIHIKPTEKGTAVVTLTLTDEDGVALIFTDLGTPQWQLMNAAGVVVNNRTFATNALTSLSWVLSGDDFAILGTSDTGKRILSFQTTYDSKAGSDLPLTGECSFYIDKLAGQV